MFKVMKDDYFLIYLAIWVLFLQFFEQAKDCLRLELHQMARVPHAVACPMNFNLVCDRGQQGGVLKLMKNNHF